MLGLATGWPLGRVGAPIGLADRPESARLVRTGYHPRGVICAGEARAPIAFRAFDAVTSA